MRLDPAHAEAHSNLGVALARRGRSTEAIDHYREALRLDPRQTQAYSNLGNALLQQGQVREAIAQFEEGLSIDPADPQARTNLAGALLRDGRIDEAIAELEEVLRVTPDFQPARRNLEIMRRQQTGKVNRRESVIGSSRARRTNLALRSPSPEVLSPSSQKSNCAPILKSRPSRMLIGRPQVPGPGGDTCRARRTWSAAAPCCR